jgi:hypothetical protein
MEIGSGIVAPTIGMLIWEHVGCKNDSDFRPSIMIKWMADQSKFLFGIYGTELAKISNFLTYINFGDFEESIGNLITPIVQLITSPVCAILAYDTHAQTYKDEGWKIIIGTMIWWGLIITAHEYINCPNENIGDFYD